MTSCSAQSPITNPWSIFKKSQNPGSITPLHTNPLLLHHQWAPLPLPLDISRFLFLIYVLFKYRRLYLFAKNLTQFYCEVLPESYRAINVENNMLPWYTKTRVLCVFVFTPAPPPVIMTLLHWLTLASPFSQFDQHTAPSYPLPSHFPSFFVFLSLYLFFFVTYPNSQRIW